MARQQHADASQLYAKNLLSFVQLIVQKDGTLKIDRDDEIVKGSLLAIDGQIVHPNFVPPAPPPAAPTTL